MAVAPTALLWYSNRPWIPAEVPVPSAEPSGDYRVNLHELIASPNSIYEVIDFLGRGTFGQVVKAWKKDTNEVVAMKILKDIPSYAKQGQVEIDVLTRLSRVSADDYNFVRAYESFQYCNHICIVFELLQVNLYDYLKAHKFQPLQMKHIRPIAQQVLTCLLKMQELGLVHADLKPENIMLVDPERQPFRIKVIDFGSATTRNNSTATTYLQSRYYRAPEVIMGLPYDGAIDMWSLGCVLAELFLGWPLFPGASEHDQIGYICQTLGPLPGHMLCNVMKASKFFRRDKCTGHWMLRRCQEGGEVPKETRKFIFSSVTDIGRVAPPPMTDHVAHSLDCMEFVCLLRSVLVLDPLHRAGPAQALQSPFITMQHLALHTNTQSVRDWIACMQVCCHSRTTEAYSPCTVDTRSLRGVPYSVYVQQPVDPARTHYVHSLAYLPQESRPHHWTDLDTGYGSADSSPSTATTTMDGLELPVFFADPSLLAHPLLCVTKPPVSLAPIGLLPILPTYHPLACGPFAIHGSAFGPR
ncbi:hypothetical protein EMCRGX_G008996 [Ephydatia muelleri]